MSQTHTITALVSKQFFPKDGNSFDGFWAGQIQDKNSRKTYGASGSCDVRKGTTYNLSGYFKTDKKWGEQFVIQEALESLEKDYLNFAKFISTERMILGIGISKAKIICDSLKGDFINKLKEGSLNIDGITRSNEASLTTWYKLNKKYVEIAFELSLVGFPKYVINQCWKRHFEKTIDSLKKDPYGELMSLKGVGFHTADSLARGLGVDYEDPKRIQEGIVQTLEEQSSDGHVWEAKSIVLNKALGILSITDKSLIEKGINDLIENEIIIQIENETNPIALKYLYDYEDYIDGVFQKYQNEGNKLFLNKEIQNHDSLNELQQKFLNTALTNKIALMTGKAGTGKTYTISKVLNTYEENGYRVLMCAPTGKAARRISQVTGRKAQTIHKLLGYSQESYSKIERRSIISFDYCEYNKLKADLVVVDEFSMADIKVVKWLLEAIDFEKTNLILIGDHNQLPPVGPGNVLRDIVLKNNFKKVVLEEVVRQAGPLRKNSSDILDGRVCKEITDDWFVNEKLNSEESVLEETKRIYKSFLNQGMRSIDIQILSPMYKGLVGVNNLNNELRILYLLSQGILITKDDYFFKVKDKVICKRNNYELGIMNGSVGVVQSSDDESKKIVVRFVDKDEDVEIFGDDLKDIKFAYALTIHSFQGDQTRAVISIIHKSQDYMLNSLGRNLFYTSVTRAQEISVILGDKETIDNTAKVNRIHERRTFLSLTG